MKTTYLTLFAGVGVFAAQGTQPASAQGAPWGLATREEPAHIGEASLVPDEGFRIEFEAPPGNFDVEFSDGLQTWTNAGAANPSPVGHGTFSDPAALDLDSGFYRVAGSYTAEDFHAILPTFAIAYGGFTEPGETQRGSFRFGGSLEQGALQYTETAPDLPGLLVLNPDGMGGEGLVRPVSSNPPLSFSDFGTEASRLALDFTAGGFLLKFPEDTYSGEGPDGVGTGITTDEAFDIPFATLDEDRSFLFGLGRIRSQTVEEPGQTPFRIDSRALVVPLVARKSLAADARDLDGPWGMVRLLTASEYNEEGDWGLVTYNTGTFVLQASASSSAAGDFVLSNGAEFEAEQVYANGAGDGMSAEFSTFVEINTLPFELEPDGRLTFIGERGFVAPSQDLFVWAGADGDTDQSEAQYAVGVRRETVPDLANKTYRVLAQGFWVADGAFELNSGGTDDTIVFNASGDSAERTYSLNFFGTDFEGNGFDGTEVHVIPNDVSVDADGQITLEAILGEAGVTVRSFGFAQEGSRLLVLADSIESDDGEAGVGIILAVQE